MLERIQYVPILKTGVAEMGAYRSLYPDVKNVIFPLFRIRPWPNANHLQHTLDKILDAVDGHAFGFELDAERFKHDNPRPAQTEFEALFNDHRGYEPYYKVLQDIPGAVPVLIPTTSVETLLHQIANADGLDRGLIIHQKRGFEFPLSDAILTLPPLPNDTIIVVDAGWSRDYTQIELWALPAIERILNALPNAEIVIASSSFPDSFTHIVGHAEEDASERRLFGVARQRFNSSDLTYGDWGSTRVSQSGGGGQIPSRIDIPNISSCNVFRADPDNDVGFPEVAWIAHHHECFERVPPCWGKETILITNDEGVGITGIKVATEVRINIHMTVQSGATSILPTDEVPYED